MGSSSRNGDHAGAPPPPPHPLHPAGGHPVRRHGGCPVHRGSLPTGAQTGTWTSAPRQRLTARPSTPARRSVARGSALGESATQPLLVLSPYQSSRLIQILIKLT